jgi:monofunctional biosynthetic peptidoglycan transglycosylase
MDRAENTSEPTAAPNTAPPSQQVLPLARSDGVAAERAEPPIITIESVVQDVAAGAGIPAMSAAANYGEPPRPLPPWAFAQAPAQVSSTEWSLPLPPRSLGFSAAPGSSTDGAARPYVPPSLEGTIRDPDRRYGKSVEQLQTVQAASSEVEAEASAPSHTMVEARIAEALRDVRSGEHGATAHAPVAPAPALLPQPPPARPDPSTGDIEPQNLRDYAGLARRALRLVSVAAAGWLGLVLLLILAYRFVNPPVSALMLQRWAFGQDIAHDWVAIENMSPHVVRAVLLSEDGRFCEHYGVDYEAIQEAVERAGSGTPRGASTISMQVVKNLFLWPSKSYLRKAIEVPLTYVMEFVWPKRRIMEVYLNIAEWGPGIFGVETASQFHFNKPARNLSEREAARLAVALPNPLIRDAGEPGPGTQRLASALQVRMRLAPSSQTACVLPKRRV